MKNILERPARFGCGAVIFTVAAATIDKPFVYKMAYDKWGREGVEPALNIFEEIMKNLPTEVVDNPEKIRMIRVEVGKKYAEETEKRKKEAALKVVDMLEARLTARGIVESKKTEKEKLVDYGVAAGIATRATLDMGRIATYAIPVVRDVAMNLEIRKYGAPQETVTPGLLKEIVQLVR